MRFRWHPPLAVRRDTDRTSDDGGGQGAEYVERAVPRTVTSDEESRASTSAWFRAHHYTPED